MDAAKQSSNASLTGQVAVITGAGRGIGAAIAAKSAMKPRAIPPR